MAYLETHVRKQDGTIELFDVRKLERSLINSGASEETARHIVEHMRRELEDGMSTSIIREHAFRLLDRMEKPAGARYSLKKALVELGPSGFPFEQFVAALFRERGYHVETNQFIKGHCAEHEVDIVVWNENKLMMAEAKFHNELGLKSDLKVALYVKARFDDLREVPFFYGKKRKLDEGWLITNTKFTDKAINYASCAGLRIVGWNYPHENNLHDLIEDVGLHPVTSLSNISMTDKKHLIEAGIILARDLQNEKYLASLGFSQERISAITDEAAIITGAKVTNEVEIAHAI